MTGNDMNRRRNEVLTAAERSEIARKAGKARAANLTSEHRSAIASKAGKASASARKKRAKHGKA